MLEVTGTDIQKLTDDDLRTLVARLALAELRAQGAPLSSVTAGGNQDAADGGVDVRVECPSELSNADFVPRAFVGFQVKKPDMPASAIATEMRPAGVLRQAIRDLAAASGAYIIISAQGSVADKPLADRRKAIRDQLHDLPDSSNLHTDFYDRERLAIWVNEYPGIIAWVMERTGLALPGWSRIGDWIGVCVGQPTPYLVDDAVCVTDERSVEGPQLTIGEGIARLRASLRTPRTCVRLVGLSGLGKTRLAQALFDDGVGDEPLDPSVAVYTDYSTEVSTPSARDMARQLVARGRSAILIVDNCNPATHAELARICASDQSSVSLLTIEYDVGDDEPELTQVFRLRSASPELVEQWLKSTFSHVSDIDRRTIAMFSDGNFRVARALAETLGRGESLGKLKSKELFARLFYQRNEPEKLLLRAAEELSLVYSLDGEDTSPESELAHISTLRATAVDELYGALIELRRRGIVQARGRWRAVLPHAIANQLASSALESIPPSKLDQFWGALPPRMLLSASRRLGYLHDTESARASVDRWLRQDGPLGDLLSRNDDGMKVVACIAPAAPESVLRRLETELDGPNSEQVLSTNARARWKWLQLLKSLAYEPELFARSATLLARFLAAEPIGNRSYSARETFLELFHLHLSGTKAPPAMRREFVKRLAASDDPALRQCALVALGGLLKSQYFTSSSSFEFGARPRDWGWRPELYRDLWNWYRDGIALAVELSAILEGVRQVLANSVRGIWLYEPCQDSLEEAASALNKEAPWIEGWHAFRSALRYDGDAVSDESRLRLRAVIELLKPSDLLHRARAIVLRGATGGWDLADGEFDDGNANSAWEKAAEAARQVGRQLALDSPARAQFVGEIITDGNPERAYQCGEGLAQSANDLPAVWRELTDRFGQAGEPRNPTVLGGFIAAAWLRDPQFAVGALDAVAKNGILASHLPYLQARIGIDESGIERLRRAIATGGLSGHDFLSIANGVVGTSPPRALAKLLEDVAGLSNGVEVALDILHMHIFSGRGRGSPVEQVLVNVGRELLCRTDLSKNDPLRDLGLDTLIRICCAGKDGEETARKLCERLSVELGAVRVVVGEAVRTLKALFETQPFLSLDVLLSPREQDLESFYVDFSFGSPIQDMDPIVLRQWADHNSSVRYPLLGRALPMFRRTYGGEDNEASPVFLEMLEHAPDKRAFLGEHWNRLHPRSGGSFVEALSRRREEVRKLRESVHPDVRQWADDALPKMAEWIDRERQRELRDEQTFE